MVDWIIEVAVEAEEECCDSGGSNVGITVLPGRLSAHGSGVTGRRGSVTISAELLIAVEMVN